MSNNLSHLSRRAGLRPGLFSELVQRARQQPLAAGDFQALGAAARTGPAPLFGTASFYDYLRPEAAGVRARVCNGTCCELAGTQPELTARLQALLPEGQVGHVACVGRCHENAAFQLDGRTYSGQVDLAQALAGERVASPLRVEASSGHVFLTAPPLDLHGFLGRWRRIHTTAAAALWQEIEVSGLRGRGGAGFPLARKLAACRDAAGDEKYIVCNGDEGDPGAFSDRYLLEQQPFLVLLGMAIAARIVGAQVAIVYIRAEYPEALASVQAAIDALPPRWEIEFHAVAGAGSYVCGEETALLNSLEGQRPEVRARPPFPVTHGLFGQPTVVSNVESLACLPAVVHHGAREFSLCGSARSTGTKLVSVDGTFRRPGVYEVPMGTPLDEIVLQLAGGPRRPLQAVQVGGPLGGIIAWPRIVGPQQQAPERQAWEPLRLDFESLHDAGFLLGHASIVGIPADADLTALALHLFAFAAAESCGKCFPCRLGTQRGVEMLQRARAGQPLDRGLFADLLETLEHGSLCALGGGLPLPIRNLLTQFPAAFAALFQGGAA